MVMNDAQLYTSKQLDIKDVKRILANIKYWYRNVYILSPNEA